MIKPTIYDVAKEAKCSPATVSLVLKNSPKIKALTKERVNSTIEKLGFVPNYMARGLINKRTNTIGIIVPDIKNPVFARMISGIEECTNKKSFNVILGISDQDEEKELLFIDMLSQKRVDGMLVFPTFLNSVCKKIGSFNNKSIPFVFCGMSVKGENYSYVKCDSESGAQMVVEYLINSGKKRIMFFAPISAPDQLTDRLDGYKKALLKHGMSYDENLVVVCKQDLDIVYSTAVSVLSRNPCDAIFCLYDYIVIPVIKAINYLGLKIPQDISIVGFDNIEISQYISPAISSVETHSKKVGKIAAEILIDKIEGRDPEVKQISLTPQLIIRQSS